MSTSEYLILHHYLIFNFHDQCIRVHLRKAFWKVLMFPYPYSTVMGTRHHARLVYISNDLLTVCKNKMLQYLNTGYIVIIITQ